MVDEFPKAFTLVFIDDGNSVLDWSFDGRSFGGIFFKFWVASRFLDVVICVKVNGLVLVSKVHEAVSARVVNLEGIVVIDLVIVVLVAAVRGYFKNELGG